MYQPRTISKGVRLTRLPDGIELYFPLLRAPAAALSLALFGAACLIPGLFAAAAVAPLSATGAGGMIALWLMSIFILPFIAFGVLFLGLAGYRLTNSLTVVVTGSHIHIVRRVLGVALREQRIMQTDISALEVVAAMPYRWLREDVPRYDLVVRTKSDPTAASGVVRSHARRVTLAEGLRGEELMEQVRAEVAAAARLGYPV